MKQFKCQSCGSVVFFRNSSCISCGAKLGYSPDHGTMFALHQADARAGERPRWSAAGGAQSGVRLGAHSGAHSAGAPLQFHFCANADHGVCNWLLPADENQPMCRSCRHNHLAPDLTIEGNLARWQRIEQAKQHLFYSLIRWGLPMPTQAEGVAEPLVFDLVADVQTENGVQRVLTGHDAGLITINIAEADDDEREKRRVGMGEPYRTLLGHFRHEIGPFYWDSAGADTRLIEFARSSATSAPTIARR